MQFHKRLTLQNSFVGHPSRSFDNSLKLCLTICAGFLPGAIRERVPFNRYLFPSGPNGRVVRFLGKPFARNRLEPVFFGDIDHAFASHYGGSTTLPVTITAQTLRSCSPPLPVSVTDRGQSEPFCKMPSACRDVLKTGQHGEIALIEHRAAVGLDIARASTLLLIGATVLGNGGTRSKKRQSGGEKKIFGHRRLSEWQQWFGAGRLALRPSRD
jgi:hypothetical protein